MPQQSQAARDAYNKSCRENPDRGAAVRAAQAVTDAENAENAEREKAAARVHYLNGGKVSLFQPAAEVEG